jgi:hypothetical protein
MRALGFLPVAFSLSASPEVVRRADALYHRAQYQPSLQGKRAAKYVETHRHSEEARELLHEIAGE